MSRASCCAPLFPGASAAELLAETNHAGGDPRFYGTERVAESLGDFKLGQATEVGHLDGHPLVVRQFTQGASHGPLRLGGGCVLGGRRRPRDLRFFFLNRFGETSACFARPETVDGAAPRKHDEPAEWFAALVIKRDGGFPNLDKRFLQDVLGLGPIIENLHREGEEQRTMARIELLKRVFVASGHGAQQRTVIPDLCRRDIPTALAIGHRGNVTIAGKAGEGKNSERYGGSP